MFKPLCSNKYNSFHTPKTKVLMNIENLQILGSESIEILII